MIFVCCVGEEDQDGYDISRLRKPEGYNTSHIERATYNKPLGRGKIMTLLHFESEILVETFIMQTLSSWFSKTWIQNYTGLQRNY